MAWLTEEEGQKLIAVMVKSEDCLPLFETETMKILTEFLWGQSRFYFVYFYFLPFIVFGFFPLLVMAFMMHKIEMPDTSLVHWAVYTATVFLFCIGIILLIKNELIEAKNRGVRKYFRDFTNLYQWIMILANITLVILIFISTGQLESSYLSKDAFNVVKALRINMIVCLLFNILEASSRVRVFDFFAYFVRQLIEIMYEALPIGLMLAMIVVTQTVLFWILDQNSDEPKYTSMSGFFNCLIDSYRLALGDFEVTGSFVDNTDNIVIFWLVFFLGTLVAMLVILNMVIAVMGGTFERVTSQQDAQVRRAQLSLISQNFHHFPDWIKSRLQDFKYLLSVEVDPEIDPIE